jgi:hypothetical protein
VALLWVAAAAGMLGPIQAMTHTVTRDYNEGWNAFWSQAALRGEDLYPPAGASISDNYPPLSFFVVGMLGRTVGDNIVAGRLVALASFCAILLAIFAWLRLVGCSRAAAAAGGGVFLAGFVGFAPAFVAMNDPQLLAHATMVTGLYVLWRSRSGSPAIAVAAALMVLAGFTKHLLLPLPLAVGTWLALYDRRRFALWASAGAAAALLLFLVFWTVYGTDFFHSLLAGRVYSVHEARIRTRNAIAAFAPMLALGAIAATSAWRSGPHCSRGAAIRLVLLYGAAALSIGALAAGGKGVDVNAFFDLLIASSLGAGLGLMALRSGEVPRFSAATGSRLSVVALWLSALIVCWGIARRLPQEIALMQRLDEREVMTRDDVRTVRELGHGRAACEELALCYWAGTSFQVDFFNYGQKLKTGMLAHSSCDRLFGTDRFDVVQIDRDIGLGSSRLTAACNSVIREHFVPIRQSPSGEILLRKSLLARSGPAAHVR